MIDLTNKKYGKLTVIKLTGERGLSGQIYWECKCDCGNIHVTSGESLRGGKSKIGMELDDGYFKIATERIANHKVT